MGVEYVAPEFFPQTCAVHVCRCGRRATVYGRHVDELPEGWERIGDEVEACAECVEARAAPSAANGPRRPA